MTTANEIEDRKTLERWLKHWPAAQGLNDDEARKIAVTIAHRAALRVLPIAWEWFSSDEARRRDLTALPILRSMLISGVASTCPTPEIKAAALAADAAALAADAAHAAALASDASDAAALAADAAARAAHAALAADAADAAARAAHAADAARAVTFSAIKVDALALEQGRTLQNAAIWPDASPDWFDKAQSAFNANLEHEAPTWDFWRRWWGGAVSGTPLSWDLQEKVALIPDEDWEKGAEHIAEVIAEIERDYALHNQLFGVSKLSKIEQDLDNLKGIIAILNADEISGDIANATSQISSISSQLGTLSNKADAEVKRLAELEKQTSDQTAVVKQQREELLQLRAELETEFKTRFETAFAAFREEQVVKEPVQLWQEKRDEHLVLMKGASNRFLGGIGAVAAMIVMTLLALLFAGDSTVALLQPSGCDPVKAQDLCNKFSVKGLIVSGSFLTLITLALWFTRLQMKIYLSERHLALDARERKAFAQAYIGLLSEDAASEEASTQRALVYSALFRPSSDGIIKEDGGLDPSLTSAMSKLLSR